MKKKKKNIWDGNTIYILWFIFYFMLTAYILSLFTFNIITSTLITLGIYAVLIPLAFTPPGEKLFKLLNGVRPLYTNHEKEKILPIFHAVHKDVTKKKKTMRKDIELCISDSLIPNAFAMGERTIVVTKGLMESMTEEQIKGILVHEYGHIIHGDTKAVVYTFIGNGILNITMVIVRKVMQVVVKVMDSFCIGMIGTAFFGILGASLRITLFIIEAMAFVVQEAGEIILMAKSRRNELCADYFAFRMNYGEELISALYDFELMSNGRTLTIQEQLKATHPHTARRIWCLESWMGISIK